MPYKSDLVRLILERNGEIAQWYEQQHELCADDFNIENVLVYGLDGLGFIADEIIHDGLTYGIITEAHIDEYNAWPPVRRKLW